MSSTSSIEAFVREVLEIAVAVKARDLRRRACAQTLPSAQSPGNDTPSRLPPPPPARRSDPDSGRYSYVSPRPRMPGRPEH